MDKKWNIPWRLNNEKKKRIGRISRISYGAQKIHLIKEDLVHKPELRFIINNSVASEIKSSHYYFLTVVKVIEIS